MSLIFIEADPLSLLYNDQSVAENRSLALAFSLFMAEPMRDLRKVIFAPNTHTQNDFSSKDEVDNYRYFRKLVRANVPFFPCSTMEYIYSMIFPSTYILSFFFFAGMCIIYLDMIV